MDAGIAVVSGRFHRLLSVWLLWQIVCKDGRFLPGAGATEIELAHRIQRLAESTPGLEQYALGKVGS